LILTSQNPSFGDNSGVLCFWGVWNDKASSSDAGILPEETRGETSREATDDDDAPGRVDDGA